MLYIAIDNSVGGGTGLPGSGGGGGFPNTYSLDFDGIDDFVATSGVYSELDGGTKMTLSVWLKPISGAPILEYIVTNPRNGTANQHQFGLVLYENNRVQFDVQAFGSQYVIADINAITYGQWNHILVCVDLDRTTGTEGAIFINGVDETTNSLMGTLSSFYNATGALHIGIHANGGYNRYNGAMDELAIWSGQDYRNESEVNSIYNSGSPTDLNNTSGIAQPNTWYRNGDNGSWKSPQWLIPNNENKDKVSNYSFEFDGVDDRVQLSSDFVASGEFTISFWMKPLSVGSPIGNIYVLGVFPSNTNYIKLDQIGAVWLKLGGVVVIFNESTYGGGSNNLVLNEWQHIAFIRDSSNIIRCYRNGVNFGYNASAPSNTSTLTLNSFGRIIINAYGFGGGLDEIALFQTDETANISTIYNGGEPTTLPSGAIAHYKMGEDATFSGGVWTVPDNAGSNNGTSNGMTIEDRVGEAPNSTSNALSFNMDEVDRTTDVPT